MIKSIYEISPPPSLLGQWSPTEIGLQATATRLTYVPGIDAIRIGGILSGHDCEQLVSQFRTQEVQPVGVNGFPDSDLGMGSVRATAWAPDLAYQLWLKIKTALEMTRFYNRRMTERTSTDFWHPTPHWRWRVCGVSPVQRFMRYENGGMHYAHYDAGYDYGDGRRTLMSVVIYLNTVEPEFGGATRFIGDGQKDLRIWDRDHSDWTREAMFDEVLFSSQPIQGSAIIFDHRICHDVQKFVGKERFIIRTDIVFKALD